MKWTLTVRGIAADITTEGEDLDYLVGMVMDAYVRGWDFDFRFTSPNADTPLQESRSKERE